MRYILYVYILLIPFLHALSPVPIQSLGFFLIVAASPLILLAPAQYTGDYIKQDVCLLLTWLIGLLAWWFYPAPIEEDRFQGAAQWFSSIIFSLIILRRLIIVSRVRLEDISRISSMSVLILTIAIMFDFLLANFEGRHLSDIIPYSVDEFPKAEVLGVLQRPRGLTTEAGFNGIIFECLAPFAIYYAIKYKGLYSFLIASALIIGLALIVSLSTLFSIIFSILLYFIYKRKSFIDLFILLFLIFAMAYFSLNNVFLFDLFGYKLAEFLDIANYNIYMIGRQGSFFYGLQVFSENLFGIGWGTILQEANIPGTIIDYNLDSASLISLWLELLVAAGIVGFALTVYVFGATLRGLVKQDGKEAGFIFVSLAAVSLHHIFVYDMWFPMIWFSLAVAQVALSSQHGAYFLSSGGADQRPSPL
jgi:hypothetical protein